MSVSTWCDRIIKGSFGLLFALVPLLLTPWNYELFEYNKMMAVYAITVIIVGAWIMKMIAQREIRIARTPLDIPILLFLGSQLLSSVFSIDPHVSWFGYYSRFNGGMLSIVSYALLYWAFVSNIEIASEHQSVRASEKKDFLIDALTHTDTLTRFFKLSLASAAAVSLYAVAERLGIDKHLWIQDVQNRVFSTFGQPNWLAAYLVAGGPLTWYFALKSQITSLKHQTNPKSQTPNSKQDDAPFEIWNFEFVWNLGFVIWCLMSVLFFTVLLFTRSRSGLFGFVVADGIFWGILFLKKQLRLSSFFLLHFSFFLVVFLNGTHIDGVDRWFTLSSWKDRILLSKSASDTGNQTVKPDQKPTSGTLLEYGGTESGKIRNFVWQGAINAWRSSTKTFFIGTGTETFAFAFFRSKPVGHNLTSEWDFLYNKAHNEYLNYLATTGILGLGSYLLFIGSFVAWFIKSQITSTKYQTNHKSQAPNTKQDVLNFGHRNFGIVWNLDFGAWCLRAALFAGWVSILITNFFGFSVVITNVFLFLFPAMVFVATLDTGPETWFSKKISFTHSLFSLTIFLALLALLALLAKNWYADTVFAAGYRWAHAAEFPTAYPLLKRAVALNGGEPFYHDEYAAALAGLAIAGFEKNEASAATELVRQSLAESDKALATSPNNVNFWKTRTKIFYSYSTIDPQWNKAAIEALQKAAALAPTDPKIYYNLAILYGRGGDNKKSIELLQKTIELKANYRDAYYGLWVFYTETKQPDLARKILQTYLDTVDPGDKDFLSRIKQ